MNETVESWMIFAQKDIIAAEVLSKNEIYDEACFHVQQCVEKVLKALFIHRRGQMPPRIHEIEDLLRLLPSEWFADIDVDLLKEFSNYYIITRYPDMLTGNFEEDLPGKAETEEAIALARIMLDKAKHLIETT